MFALIANESQHDRPGASNASGFAISTGMRRVLTCKAPTRERRNLFANQQLIVGCVAKGIGRMILSLLIMWCRLILVLRCCLLIGAVTVVGGGGRRCLCVYRLSGLRVRPVLSRWGGLKMSERTA